MKENKKQEAKEEQPKSAKQLILDERQRQISKEGWTIEHDDHHIYSELAKAADCYYEYAEDNDYTDKKVHQYWPWEKSWWKPKNQLQDYIKAGALYTAEMQRLERKGGLNGQKYTNLRIGIRQCEIRIDEIQKAYLIVNKDLDNQPLVPQDITVEEAAKAEATIGDEYFPEVYSGFIKGARYQSTKDAKELVELRDLLKHVRLILPDDKPISKRIDNALNKNP